MVRLRKVNKGVNTATSTILKDDLYEGDDVLSLHGRRGTISALAGCNGVCLLMGSYWSKPGMQID